MICSMDEPNVSESIEYKRKGKLYQCDTVMKKVILTQNVNADAEHF
jgi:hypothetical protein